MSEIIFKELRESIFTITCNKKKADMILAYALSLREEEL